MTRRRWPTSVKLLVATFLVVAVAGLLYRFQFILPPLVLAAILAYVITPAVDYAAARSRLPRNWVIAIFYLLLAALLIGLSFMLVPLAVNQLRGIEVEVQDIIARYTTLRQTALVVGEFRIDVGAVIDRLTGPVTEAVNRLAGQSVAIVSGIAEFFVATLIVLIASFYLVKDGERFHGKLEGLAPAAYRDDYSQLRDEIAGIWAAFFRGQIVLAMVVAVLFTVFGSLIGLRYAVAMGLLAGTLEFLPSIGHTIWLVVAVILAFAQGSTWLPIPGWAFALLVVGLHVVFQQLDWNFLIPRIIGSRMKLHPLVVIIGIVVGAILGGVLGIALAAPTIASLRVLGRYVYAGLFDLEPFKPVTQQTTENTEIEHDRQRTSSVAKVE